MANPTSQLRTLRPELSTFEELNNEMQVRGYVGTRILPAFPVNSAGATFGVIKLKSLLAAAGADTKRTSTGGYNRGDYEFEDRIYTTRENGWEEPIDARELNMYSSFFDLETIAAQRAWEHVLNSLERRIIAATVGATVTAGYTTGASGAAWTNFASSNPITDVFAAQEAIWLRTGLWARTLTVSRRSFRNLRRNVAVITAMQGGGTPGGVPGTQKTISIENLCEVLDLEDIVVADSVKNTANMGQTTALESVFPETQALVSVAAKSNDFKEPCLGRTFHWGGDGSQMGDGNMIGVVERYEEPQTRKDILRVRHETAEFILYGEAAQVITGVR